MVDRVSNRICVFVFRASPESCASQVGDTEDQSSRLGNNCCLHRPTTHEVHTKFKNFSVTVTSSVHIATNWKYIFHHINQTVYVFGQMIINYSPLAACDVRFYYWR